MMDEPFATQEIGMVFPRPPSPEQAPDPSQPVPRTDLVGWQSTQPLPALNALLKDSAASRSTRRVSHGTCPSTSFFPDNLSSPDASSSRSASGSTSTTSRRFTSNKTSASRRARPRYSDSTPNSASTAPIASPFTVNHSFASGGDGQASFVDLLKSVSKIVDENARIKKRHLDKQNGPQMSGHLRVRKARMAATIARSQDELLDKTNASLKDSGGSIKGKERMRALDASLPTDIAPTFSPMDVDTSTPQALLAEGVDIVRDVTSSADRMPPPPVPAKVSHRLIKVPQPPRPSTSVTRSYSPPTLMAPSSTPTPSFSRPPALGMRRTVTTGSNPFTPSQKALPSKQKGFKPPLAKPSAANAPIITGNPQHSLGHKVNTIDTSGAGRSTSHTFSYGTPASQGPSSHPTTTSAVPDTPPLYFAATTPIPQVDEEADTSYGELSFDMDVLEEAMKEYDE